jgi:energy-coupling factor transporter ATP-binding protein EcfA2
MLDWMRKQKDSKPDPLARVPGVGLYMGRDEKGREAWLNESAVRQHVLVLGTTGSGKTEFLVSLVSGALSWGSGAVFVDGKGDASLYAKVMVQAHAYGREEDVLVLNFMTGPEGGSGILSNTFNPFARGASDEIVQMVVDMMDDAGGDGAMWKGRATAMLTGVARCLVWRRDNQGARLDVSVLRDHLGIRRIIDMSEDGALPLPLRKSVSSYLTSLPGYREEKGHKQSQTTLDQHGYLEMQFTKLLGSLADVYGHVFCPSGAPDIDIVDVVRNRRVLVVLLPALAKSGDETRNLGKIVVGSLRAMMGSVLGRQISGEWDEVAKNNGTKADSPYLCILDEVGSYMAPGLAVMSAQARSLGFGMVFAAQDQQSIMVGDGREGRSIVGNTNTKVFMRQESAVEGLPPEAEAKLPGLRPGQCVLTHRGEVRYLTTPHLDGNPAGTGVRLAPSALGDAARLGSALAARRRPSAPAPEPEPETEEVAPAASPSGDGLAALLASIELPPLPQGFELDAGGVRRASSGDDLASAALRSVGACLPRSPEDAGPMLDLATGKETVS